MSFNLQMTGRKSIGNTLKRLLSRGGSLLLAGALLLGTASCGRKGAVSPRQGIPGWTPSEFQPLSVDGGLAGPGKVITAWRFAADEQTAGKITGPFDWEFMLSEEAPRGPITLYGEVDSEPWEWTGRLDQPVSIFLREEPSILPIRPELDEALANCNASGPGCSTGDHAWWLYEAGRREHRQGRLALAVERFEEAVATVSGDPCARLLIENRVGRFLLKKGEGVAAGPYLRGGQSLTPPECTMISAERHLLEGEFLQGYGDSDLSRRSLQLALAQLLERAPGSRRAIEASLLAGLQMTGAGSSSRSVEYLQLAESNLQDYPNDPLWVDLWITRGRNYRLRNDLSMVREALAKAVDAHRVAGSHGLREMRLMISLAQQEADSGDLLGAEQFTQRALSISRATTPGGPYEALVMSYVSQFYRQIMEFGLAEDYAERTYALRKHFGEDCPAAMRSLATLGEIASSRGDFERAEEIFSRVLSSDDMASRHGRVVALARLGDLAWRRGKTERAVSLYQRALIESDTSGHFRRLIGIHTSLARALLLQGRYDQAEMHLDHAMERLGADYVNDTWRAEILHNRSQISRARGDSEGELLYLETAMAALDTLMSDRARSDELQGEWSARFQPVYHSLAELHLSRGEVDKAFEVFERHKARRFLDRLTERNIADRGQVPDSLREAQVETWKAYDDLQEEMQRSVASQTPKLSARNRELESLQRKLYRRRQELSDQATRLAREQYGDLASTVVDSVAVSEELEPSTVLISFEVGELSAKAFVIESGQEVEYYEIDRSRENLAQDVNLLRELVANIRPGYPRYDSRQASLNFEAHRLFELLLGPARETIDRSSRLLIVPDGPLFTLPFSALRTAAPGARSGRALGTLIPLHFAPSASVYFGLRQADRAKGEAVYAYDLVALADPSPNEPAGSLLGLAAGSVWENTPPLPFSRKEVSDIGALFPAERVRQLIGTEATESFVKANLISARAIHFATHGTVDHLYPLNSGLLLNEGPVSQPAQNDQVGGQAAPREGSQILENGWLQAWEVLDQVHLETDLVVLSACETGLGSARGTEGLIGLTRAFHYAGAPSVISSLWRVADNGTSEFMRRFYGYVRQGSALSEALRTTQRDLATGVAGERFAAPYYWAGFQLSGDWR